MRGAPRPPQGVPVRSGPAGAGPVKRSFRIAGHSTSVSLEAAFWGVLQEAAAARGVTLTALVAEIDAGRAGTNLSSAIRVWLLAWVRGGGGKRPDEVPGSAQVE